jgi:DNA-binding MarR family transcriptional regulator
MQDTTTFKLIERISTLLRSEERKKYAAIGLHPIHVQVLDYLANCNYCSDTPAAVTEYFGLTKGTVSQSLQVLERKGYINKNQDSGDGRVIHLTLTARGEQLLTEIQALDVFAQAEEALASQEFSTIGEALKTTLLALQKVNDVKSFGVCHTCINFDEEDNHYLCKLTQLPLSRSDADKICREHILAEAE